MTTFRTLLRISRPLFLLFAALMITLGTGMARYLGTPLRLAAFLLGLLTVLLLQAAAFLLVEYFRLPMALLAPGETPRQRERLRTLLLQVAAAALVLATALTIILLHAGLLPLPVGSLLGLCFIFLVVYSLPPMRLSESGYGELILAIYFATLLPALAFLLQSDSYHRLLPMATFPLTLLALAYLIVLDFPAFAADQKQERHSLLTRITWQYAIPIHHVLVLAAYLLYAAAPFLGFPWGLVWPVFLTLPFAGLQIYWLQRIANGGRPVWNFLTALAAAVFGLTAYLITFTFWIR